MESKTVSILLTVNGVTVGVFASRKEAEERRDEFNADPFMGQGVPDTDAPYSVDTWAVR